jgi:epoxyqueuosine reductase
MLSRSDELLNNAPELFVQEIIDEFMRKSPLSRRDVDGKKFFDSALVGFASGDDPLFVEYKNIIGEFHFTPRQIFNLTFGETNVVGKLSVIAWVLPISEDTRKANRNQHKFPSLLWSHTRYFGEPFNFELRKYVVSVLMAKGFRAVAPVATPHFIHFMHGPRVGFTSNFSERHAAYACGLGTFSLSDGFITPRGKAIRLGVVVTDLVLKASIRPYANYRANCLYFFNGTCKVCIERCPAGAIKETGHDKDRCYDFMHNVCRPAKNSKYGVEITGCGLCQTKVPCEFEIPKLVQRHSMSKPG